MWPTRLHTAQQKTRSLPVDNYHPIAALLQSLLALCVIMSRLKFFVYRDESLSFQETRVCVTSNFVVCSLMRAHVELVNCSSTFPPGHRHCCSCCCSKTVVGRFRIGSAANCWLLLLLFGGDDERCCLHLKDAQKVERRRSTSVDTTRPTCSSTCRRSPPSSHCQQRRRLATATGGDASPARMPMAGATRTTTMTPTTMLERRDNPS